MKEHDARFRFADYPRIAVVGSPGSGKSTLARQIAARTGHSLIHLDYEYWRAGWAHPSKEEWRGMQEAWVQGDRWIIDGNYGDTLELRYSAADLVIFLDIPRAVCLWRVLRRRRQFRPDMRPEVTEPCLLSKHFLEFCWFIWRYPRKGKRQVLALHAKYPGTDLLLLRKQGTLP